MLKRITKISSFVIIAMVLLFISTNSVFASSSGRKNINETISLMNANDLQFSNISYKNWSNTSTKAFGLAGLVYNGYAFECSFNATATYYDSNSNIIATTHNSQVVPAGDYNSYSQMSNLSEIKNGYTADDIVYYKLDVEVISNNEVVDSKTITNTIGNGEYAITKYHIDMKVNENNTFDMNEQITAYFNIAKHGIFRSLPLKNTINRIDGTSSNNRAKITNVEVNNNYTTYKENGNYVIKIGSASSTLTGEQLYTVKYNYNIGKDPSKDYDELYFNLIGTEWDTTISNFTFTITMPKEFDESKLGFSLGSLGSTNNTDINYTVNGNVITGSCNRVVKSGEALTVRMELPEGYFVGANNGGVGILTYLLFIFPIIFVGLSFLLWKKYGKDDQVVETVEFHPPEGFNSLEIGYLYKGKAGNQDVVSLLIYLANNGYIKIIETEEKTLISTKKGFKIIKLKEYDGNNINEKIFLTGLFTKKKDYSFSSTISMMKNPSEVDTDESNEIKILEVSSKDLHNNFYITMREILNNINNKKNKNKIFEKAASSKKIFIILMIIFTFCLITIPPMLEFSELILIIMALIFTGIGFSIILLTLFGASEIIIVEGGGTNSSITTKIFGLILGGVFGVIPWSFMVLPALLGEKIYLYEYIVGIMCIIGMTIFLKYLPKRTTYGNHMLGKLRGFKNFLETAEKQELEALVMQDPQYFYNILPYTYVLGVSNKWISKFETITLQSPNWYDGATAFDVVSFGTFMDSTMASASSVMSSSPSSDSGGSSGGGSGGGGGGSW